MLEIRSPNDLVPPKLKDEDLSNEACFALDSSDSEYRI